MRPLSSPVPGVALVTRAALFCGVQVVLGEGVVMSGTTSCTTSGNSSPAWQGCRRSGNDGEASTRCGRSRSSRYLRCR